MNDRNNRDRDAAPEFDEKTVFVNRCAKTVKGGRRFSFSAIIVVGDNNGRVGLGIGKANEVGDAIRKGGEAARKAMRPVCMKGSTIPHEVYGVCDGGKVLLKPAPDGTGIICGGAMRPVLEAAGIKNIRAKCLRSNNPTNVVKATMEGLKELRTAEEVAKIRDIPVEQVKA